MRILFITPRFPYPLDRGDRHRAYHLIRHLTGPNEVVLVSLTDEAVPPEGMALLRPHCAEIHVFERSRLTSLRGVVRAVVRGEPLQVGYFDDPSAHREIDRIAATGNFDAAFVQLIRTAPYGRHLPMRTVLEYQDAFSSITRRRAENAPFLTRLPLRIEADRIGRFERQAQGWFDASCIISEQDRDRLPVPDRAAVHVLRNGVDTEDFSSPDVEPLDVTADICFVGNMGYRPNVRAAAVLVEEIQPRLVALRGRTTILLSGARPARSVQRLAGPDVHVTGWVDDVRRPYLSGSVMVAPLFTGGGQQNKVLEAMAVGVPCVTSGVVNNAIGAEPGTEIVIADDAAEFAARTAELLADPESRRRIGSAGQRFVRERYGWRTTVDQLERILKGP